MSARSLPSRHRVHLLEVQPDLADAIPAGDRLTARQLLVADADRLTPGPWRPEARDRDGGAAFGVVLAGGLVLREVVLGGRRAAQLFGPGDVLHGSAPEVSSLSEAVEWTVMDGGLAVLLGGGFVAAVRRWPALGIAINDRLFAQVDRAAAHLAIAQLPRVDQRLLGMLWLLADRSGYVSGAGVVMPFTLTHDALGRLVGARRPTVSLGLAALQECGAIARRADGGWLLDPRARSRLTAARAASAGADDRPPAGADGHG